MKFAPYEICTNEICTIKNDFAFFKDVVAFQNGGQITDFCFASFRFWQKKKKKKKKRKEQIRKTTFQKEFFIKIWPKLGENE